MCRSPADERAVIKERLDQAQQGLLDSGDSGTKAVNEGIYPSICVLRDFKIEPRECSCSPLWMAFKHLAVSFPGSGCQEGTPTSRPAAVEEPVGQPAAQAAPQAYASSAPSRSIPDTSSQGMQQTLQMMQQNPALMEQMRNTLASMSPEQMQAAVSPSLLHNQLFSYFVSVASTKPW